jgi:hypothetical protein
VPWSTTDFRVDRRTVPFVDDQAVFQYQPVSGGMIWRVEMISLLVAFDPTVNVVPIEVYVFDVLSGTGVAPVDQTTLDDPGAFLSGQLFGAEVVFDVAEYDPPITVTEGNALSVFLSANVGVVLGQTTASARVQYSLLQGAPGATPTPVAGAQ